MFCEKCASGRLFSRLRKINSGWAYAKAKENKNRRPFQWMGRRILKFYFNPYMPSLINYIDQKMTCGAMRQQLSKGRDACGMVGKSIEKNLKN